MKKNLPVIVWWNDAVAYPKQLIKLDNLTTALMKTIGYLYHKDKKRIILKRQLTEFEGNFGSEDEAMVIPMGCVNKIVYLKEK